MARWPNPASIPASEKGAANGVASLDGTAKVPAAQLPASSGGGGGPASPLLPDGLLYTMPPQYFASLPASPGPTVLALMRVLVPKAGTLRDLSVFVGSGVDAGFIRSAIYDAGGNFVWASTRHSPGTSRGWITGDPALVVTAGQELWLGIATEGVNLVAIEQPGNVASLLPTGFWPPHNRTLGWATITDLNSFPASFVPANLSLHAWLYAMMARIT